MIKEVLVFKNGNICLLNEEGEQMLELQYELSKAKKYLWWEIE